MGGVVGKSESHRKFSIHETKLEAKMVEAMQRRAAKGSVMKSFNSLILKFPKIDESLRNCKAIFEQFDEDSNGMIDQEEMKKCFSELEVSFTDEEIIDLFEACDINEHMGIKFNEFIVLICLVHLLKDDNKAVHTVSKHTYLVLCIFLKLHFLCVLFPLLFVLRDFC
ncbi:unnamed protein product [Malus baccata var. baccata]